MTDKDAMPLNDRTESEAGQLTRRKILAAGATVAGGATLSSLLPVSSAEADTPVSSARTMILASHPYPERSVVNKALWEVAKETPDASFRNLESVFGSDLRGFDRAAERRLYEPMQRLVLIYPTHWFNLTPMLKAYLNEVWGAGAPPELRGKELLVVTTTGGSERDYSPNGNLGYTLEEVLTPLRATARYTGMKFLTPVAFFGARGDSASLRSYQNELRKRLTE